MLAMDLIWTGQRQRHAPYLPGYAQAYFAARPLFDIFCVKNFPVLLFRFVTVQLRGHSVRTRIGMDELSQLPRSPQILVLYVCVLSAFEIKFVINYTIKQIPACESFIYSTCRIS